MKNAYTMENWEKVLIIGNCGLRNSLIVAHLELRHIIFNVTSDK